MKIEYISSGVTFRLAAAMLLPFAVMSLYLTFSRLPSYQFIEFGDFASLGVSLLVVVLFIVNLLLRGRYKVASLLAYIPIILMLLVVYSFCFVAMFFDETL